MNILLISEYSRLHNSLKEGLQELGHHVVILGFSDGFKNFPVDYKLEKKWDNGFKKKIKVAIQRLTCFNITSYLTYRQFKKFRKNIVGFDTVQLINENSFYCGYYFETKILKYILKHNPSVFLLSCGTDYTYVNYSLEHLEFKSIVQPYRDGKISKKDFFNVLKFRRNSYKKIHDFVFEHCKGVIASDMDYHLPLQNHPKYLGLIANPVNVDQIVFQPIVTTGKIVIFLGINDESYYKKGCDYFEKALEIIREKYPDQTEVIVTHSVPYTQYITSYDKAHILLDQTFAYDQGYNALEAMAKGKVVFTGAEREFYEKYDLAEPVNINARPDVKDLVDDLSKLIENPEQIVVIGKNARIFIEKEHNYVKIAQQYLSKWQ